MDGYGHTKKREREKEEGDERAREKKKKKNVDSHKVHGGRSALGVCCVGGGGGWGRRRQGQWGRRRGGEGKRKKDQIYGEDVRVEAEVSVYILRTHIRTREQPRNGVCVRERKRW